MNIIFGYEEGGEEMKDTKKILRNAIKRLAQSSMGNASRRGNYQSDVRSLKEKLERK